MMDVLNQLLPLNTFKGLERGVKVYSRQYGLGEVHSLYGDDEVIVQFSGLRKRMSIHDGISRIPEGYLKKPKNTKIEVVVDGKHISFAEFKRKNREEKKRIKLEEQIRKEERKRLQK